MTKTKTPAKPKPVNMTQEDWHKKFIQIQRGTYVSKSAYGKLQGKFLTYTKIWESDWASTMDEHSRLNSSIRDISEENKALKERNEKAKSEVKIWQTGHDKVREFWLAEDAKNKKQISEEIKIAKFNFKWAILTTITTLALSACLLYIITR